MFPKYNSINSNFGVNTKIVKTGVSSKTIIDYKLSRYACYLIVQNANPKFKAVALGQTYFAVQTRKMELAEEEIKKAGKNYKNGEENILRDFRQLSSASKKENLEAAIGAYNVYEKLSKAGISIDAMENNPEIKNIIGVAIHTDWLKRNVNHPDDSLKVSYDKLDSWTKQQDLTVFSALLGVVKANGNKYLVEPVSGEKIPNYFDEDQELLVTGRGR